MCLPILAWLCSFSLLTPDFAGQLSVQDCIFSLRVCSFIVIKGELAPVGLKLKETLVSEMENKIESDWVRDLRACPL